MYTHVTTGFVDYAEVEPGYRTKLSTSTPFGTTRGPISLVNFACSKRHHRNTRFSTHEGTINLVATRAIAPGDEITANYSTHVGMSCPGCNSR